MRAWGALLLVALTGCARVDGWIEPRIDLVPPTPSTVVLDDGRRATATVRIVPEPGLAEVSGLRAHLHAAAPEGVAVVFAPALAAAGEEATLHLEAAPTLRSGAYELEIYATTSNQVAKTTLRMVIP